MSRANAREYDPDEHSEMPTPPKSRGNHVYTENGWKNAKKGSSDLEERVAALERRVEEFEQQGSKRNNS